MPDERSALESLLSPSVVGPAWETAECAFSLVLSDDLNEVKKYVDWSKWLHREINSAIEFVGRAR